MSVRPPSAGPAPGWQADRLAERAASKVVSGGAMSGTLARPAAGPSLPGAAIGAVNGRRLAAASLAAVAMHVVLLAIRPGASAGNNVAPSVPPVVAVRMLRLQPVAQEVPIAAHLAPAPNALGSLR